MATGARRRRSAATAKKKAEPPFFRPFSKIAKKPERPAAAPSPPPPPPPREAAPPKVDPAGDADTFAVYMAGVRALDAGPGTRIPRTASQLERADKAPLAADPDAEARARLRSLVAEGIRFETVDDGERIEGRRLDVDPRDLRRLRRGQFAIDGKLDLHGLGAGEARAAVEAFIKKRATSGDLAVLVVHGKGAHSPRGVGVLRGEIAAWLSQGRAARHVRAFATAPDDEGGTGAVLVLLAR